jgi:hypothetical protein
MPLHLARVVLVVWVFSIERKKYRAGIRPQFVAPHLVYPSKNIHPMTAQNPENPENPDMALK